MLMQEVVGAMEPIAAGEGVGIELRPRGDDPVIADPLRIRQVLLNLLTNAVKFTQAGGTVVIEDGWTEEAVTISVRDTGPGIEEHDLGRIFEPFERAHPGTEGAGLGLPISRRIAELHGGSLEVRSTPGEGSTFILTLPRRGAPEPRGLTQPTILVLEDVATEDGTGSRVRDLLRSQGFDAFGVRSPDEALARFTESAPDLVVVDLGSDREVRLDVVRVIREDPVRLDVPVLAISDVDDPTMADRALGAGCDDVTTAIGARSLALRVRRILQREYS
jgi:CheY-like chemotaxis protein/anti-sigma regulatory factor (Ser/Thr protein kinase)